MAIPPRMQHGFLTLQDLLFDILFWGEKEKGLLCPLHLQLPAVSSALKGIERRRNSGVGLRICVFAEVFALERRQQCTPIRGSEEHAGTGIAL
jgi:hypothetical protein